MTEAELIHAPGSQGVMGPESLCGVRISQKHPVLKMHEWDYNCKECAAAHGEVT